MEAVVIFLFALAIVAGYIITAIRRAIQSHVEAKSVFKGSISRDRARFLHDVFGLTTDECKLLHFDGHSFHLRKRCSYREVTSVSLVDDRKVRVTNPRLPHHTTWQHTRVDGGPDRRYRSNPQILVSRKFRIRFNGKRDYILVGYTMPNNNVSKTLQKVNNLLSSSAATDLEAKFTQYADAFNRALHSQHLLDRALTEQARLGSVVSAFRRLKRGSVSSDPSVTSRHNEAVLELNHLNLEIQRLRKELGSATAGMAQIVQSVHREIDHYKDLQEVRSYRPSLASQKRFEQVRDKTQQRTDGQRRVFKDYYRILQVDPSAEPEVITGAYRRLAAKYHPDVYRGRDVTQQMRLINEAYTVLSDPAKRKRYDQVRGSQIL